MRTGQYLLMVAVVAASAAGAMADMAVTLDSYEYLSGPAVWQYTYEIANNSSDDYLYYFELNPVDNADITGYPTGWGDTYEDTSIGGYAAWNATSTTDWVDPSGSLSGFVIESPYGPVSGYVEWYLAVDDDGCVGGTNWAEEAGIDGPHIPEPSTLALLVAGVGAILARRRRAVADS